MAEPKYTYEQLLEKIVRAKIHLEGRSVPHKMSCPAEDLTGHPARCTCGADEANAPVERALAALKL